ncbi:MAG: SIR2 family protein [Magnetococcales bacterium]|nr:SIR2 family protein [Magnetococcales bacterium]
MPKILRTPETMRAIHEGIRTAQFTPFLGAGSSALRSENLDLTQEPWKEVSARIAALHHQADDETQKYLRSFFDRRLGCTRPPGDQVFNSTAPIPSYSDKVFILQGKLAKSITELTKVFGDAFTKTCQSVDDLRDIHVPYEINDYLGSFQALKEAIDAAAKIDGRGHAPVPGRFNVSGVLKKLLALAHCLASQNTRGHPLFNALTETYHNEIVGGLTSTGSSLNTVGSLRIEYLEWLSDVLWYTLRFGISHYPTTSEMALELSLCDSFTPPVTPDLAQVAEGLKSCRDNEPSGVSLAKFIKPYIEYWETNNTNRQLFHRVITAVLYYQYEVYVSSKRVIGQRDNPGKLPLLPILFTTNFDQIIEQHYGRNSIDYHVIVPSYTTGQTGYWKYLTNNRGAFEDPVPCEEAISVEGIPSKDLVGPIVVKLHGSPLTPLSKGSHTIVLSESDYLNAMLSATPLPRFLENSLVTKDRQLWFLGYSMSDWNIKLRLYKHAYGSQGNQATGRTSGVFRPSKHTPRESPQTVAEESVYPVSAHHHHNKHSLVRRVSPYRIAIFEKLNIELYDDDIHSLAIIVHDSLVQIISTIQNNTGDNPFSMESQQRRDRIVDNMQKLLK